MSEMVEAVKEEGIAELRKSRVVSAGVADLMKALKPNKKGGTKGRNKQVKVGNTTFRGQSSSLSL